MCPLTSWNMTLLWCKQSLHRKSREKSETLITSGMSYHVCYRLSPTWKLLGSEGSIGDAGFGEWCGGSGWGSQCYTDAHWSITWLAWGSCMDAFVKCLETRRAHHWIFLLIVWFIFKRQFKFLDSQEMFLSFWIMYSIAWDFHRLDTSLTSTTHNTLNTLFCIHKGR